MKRLLSITVLLASCGGEEIPREPEAYWDPTLESLYYEFVSDAEEYGVVIPDQYTVVSATNGDPTEEYPQYVSGWPLGVCVEVKSEYFDPEDVMEMHKREDWKEVIINFDALSYEDIKVVAYHEFGHCFLGKDHAKNPLDIMYPYFTSEVYKNWDKTLERFFLNEELDQ
jgi:hypothetical protein